MALRHLVFTFPLAYSNRDEKSPANPGAAFMDKLMFTRTTFLLAPCLLLTTLPVGCGGKNASGGGTQVPPAPTGLVATAGNAQLSLSWTASSGATSYNVQRSTTSGNNYSK